MIRLIVRAAFTVVVAVSSTACTRMVVHKNPTEHDKGIRYYRPKPYLFITPDSGGGGGGAKPAFSVTQPAPLQVEVQQKTAAVTEETGLVRQASYQPPQQPIPTTPPKAPAANSSSPAAKISMQLMYLPDFAEEYAIQLRPGLGIGELNIKLENGWNLTSVGVKTDQQTDEIIKSTADLVSSVGGLAGGGKQKSDGTGPEKNEIKALATNIPFGFYEAVIATDPCGRKQLYGWRYIGFMPFQACPTTASGQQSVCCDDPNAIYGMVMDSEGVLVFKKIAEIPHADLASKAVAAIKP